MATVKLSVHEQRIAERFVASVAPDPDSFCTTISSDDEMFLRPLGIYGGNRSRALWRYLSFGDLMLREVSQIVEWAKGWSEVKSFLDFASGHGRFTRFLLQHLPASRVTASDIYRNAMRFQARQFGVRTIRSRERPSDFDPGARFDVIFVASLFSHLPPTTFGPWLVRLRDLLEDDGILIFSTFGVADKPPRTVMRDGIGFAAVSESRSLPPETYGRTHVTPQYVESLIASWDPKGAWAHRFIPNGFVGHQDLNLVCRSESHSLATLDYSPGVMGHMAVNQEGSLLKFAGWASDLGRDGSKVEVEVRIDGHTAARVAADKPRPDVARRMGQSALNSGWWCPVDSADLDPTTWISVHAANQDGDSMVLALDTLAGHLAEGLGPQRRRGWLRRFFAK